MYKSESKNYMNVSIYEHQNPYSVMSGSYENLKLAGRTKDYLEVTKIGMRDSYDSRASR